MNWKPIETAPKDGQVVLLVNKFGEYQVCNFGARSVFDRHGNWVYGECEGDYNFYSIFKEPSHWMPLPEPPK